MCSGSRRSRWNRANRTTPSTTPTTIGRTAPRTPRSTRGEAYGARAGKRSSRGGARRLLRASSARQIVLNGSVRRRNAASSRNSKHEREPGQGEHRDRHVAELVDPLRRAASGRGDQARTATGRRRRSRRAGGRSRHRRRRPGAAADSARRGGRSPARRAARRSTAGTCRSAGTSRARTARNARSRRRRGCRPSRRRDDEREPELVAPSVQRSRSAACARPKSHIRPGISSNTASTSPATPSAEMTTIASCVMPVPAVREIRVRHGRARPAAGRRAPVPTAPAGLPSRGPRGRCRQGSRRAPRQAPG